MLLRAVPRSDVPAEKSPVARPPAERCAGDTDIAFAASAVEDPSPVRLYYSIADKDMLCATIRRL